MKRACLLAAAVVACVLVAEVASAQTTAAPYQRNRQAGVRDARGYGRYPIYRPRPPFNRPGRQQAAIAAGSFQRPYPYHLDYYRQRYGGGYEPYFGNLYGSPNIVGTQPFAFSQYPTTPYAAPYPATQPAPVIVAQPAPVAAPAATPSDQPAAASQVVCPHCQQLLELRWQPPQP